MTIKIFYSWQATTDTRYNRNFISSCITKAVAKVKNKPQFKGITFEVLDGVKGEPGSPSVASKITDERIPSCDIFIADLSVVNKIPKPVKKFLNFIGIPFKPFQNNNVINEHGVALNAIGLEKIIGVLNNLYGSPNENPDNIPFDLRHLKFPIEYTYSKKTKNKDDISRGLISQLASALENTVEFAINHQKSKYKPFSVWDEWEELTIKSKKFFANEKIEEIIDGVRKGVINPKESIRIIGLSGLGKTRVLLEAFRENIQQGDAISMRNRVLYVNHSYYTKENLTAIVLKLIHDNENRILVIDNCPKDLHRKLVPYIQNDKNQNSLITIDSNPEEVEQDRIDGVNYLIFRKEDLNSIVADILREDFSFLSSENAEKIKEFSQGIPLMAVLLGESVRNGEVFIGKLSDKDLLNKLLGDKGQDPRARTILKSCSIFNYFGYSDDFISQLEFIASNKHITSLDGENQVITNEFYEVCEHYLKREIFERKGRLIGMRPFPLAMYLAQEWLEACSPQRLMDVISTISVLPEPDKKSLIEAIAEQMKYLGFNDKAVTIVEKIVGVGGPFDDAEVLNTELGSRLFRSFVEVNPIAVSENLFRLFKPLTKDYLLKIVNGRRNLIWVLEKVCFDKRTFNKGAKVLSEFAIAENETWGNNATNQFLHLFKLYLAGTEANLAQRTEILQWLLEQPSDEYLEFAIKAMRSGLDFGHFSRMGGSEMQGSRKLIDYQPSSAEIKEYWEFILIALKSIVEKSESHSDLAMKVIANSIRSVCAAGFADIILPIIDEIIQIKNGEWEDGLKGLQHTKRFERQSLSESQFLALEEKIEKLTKRDFVTRYRNIMSSYYLDRDEKYSTEKIIQVVENLADEFIGEKFVWQDHYIIFYGSQQHFSFYFGKRIYELIRTDEKKVDEFLTDSLNALKDIDVSKRNVEVLKGFILRAERNFKLKAYDLLQADDKLNNLLFHFISNDEEGKEYFDKLFYLIDSGKSDLSNFNAFNYSIALQNCNTSEIEQFVEKLYSYGDDSKYLVFEIIFNLGYGDERKKKSLLPLLKKSVNKIIEVNYVSGIVEEYRWSEAICNILDSGREDDFAVAINRAIINSISWENSYHLNWEVQKIYEKLLQNYFDVIWPDLSAALLGEDDLYVKFYGLKDILGSRIGGVGKTVGVLFSADLDKIFEWVSQNSPLAASRLAELVPIYAMDNTKYSELNPIAKRLIDDFGELEEVVPNLSANMGTYSWSGSIIPLLEAKKELFKSLLGHPKKPIADWAERYLSYADDEIQKEKYRYEERGY